MTDAILGVQLSIEEVGRWPLRDIRTLNYGFLEYGSRN